jgi:hypothetical protein
VTDSPSAQWTAQQLTEAFPYGNPPPYLPRDRDRICGLEFQARAFPLGLQEKLIAARAPWQSPFAERLIGSIRREGLDHIIVLHARHLHRVLSDHGLDVTSEHSTGARLDAFVGLQPMAWIYEPPAPDIPPSLYCGTPMHAEGEIWIEPKTLPGLLEQFCLQAAPKIWANAWREAHDNHPPPSNTRGNPTVRCLPEVRQ